MNGQHVYSINVPQPHHRCPLLSFYLVLISISRVVKVVVVIVISLALSSSSSSFYHTIILMARVYYIYIFLSFKSPPKQWYHISPRAPYSSHLPSILSYVADTYFWLVVVWKLICLRLFKAMVYFFFFFLCCSIFVTTMVSYFPHASRSSHLTSILPSVVDAFFLVGCCVSRCQSRAIHRQRCISYIYFFIV